jgi:hypothetical protein
MIFDSDDIFADAMKGKPNNIFTCPSKITFRNTSDTSLDIMLRIVILVGDKLWYGIFIT